MASPKILTREIFSNEVEAFVLQTGTTYFDAILNICQQRELEIETVAKLVNTNIKAMLEKEAIELNLLEKRSTLDFE